jgi:N-hydroxyarylamine O-acetyltransferase
MDTALLDDVLAKLGVDRGAITADSLGLREVYRAWCRSVPFDNLVKRIHIASGDPAPIPNGDPQQFFESWLEHGTGGTCWPSTLALHSLLVALGFDVRIGAAAMRDDLFPGVQSHGTLLVTTGDDLWWVDSSMLTEEPVPLRRGEQTALDQVLRPVRVEPVGDLWRVHWFTPGNADTMGCLLLDDDVTPEHCRERYEWSRGVSPFNMSLYTNRGREQAVDEFVGGEYVVRDPDGVHRRAVAPEERDELLRKVFGYSQAILDRTPPDVVPEAGS